MGRNLDPGELIHLLTLLLIPVARNGVLHPDRTVPMFHAAERIGVHTLPVHFHSPIPDTAALDEPVWRRRFDQPEAWSLNTPRQLELLASLGRYAPELSGIPDEAEEPRFYWNNPHFGQVDAVLYYSLIRHFRSRQVIEVGSGYSTLLAALACARNGGAEVRAIDPFPRPFLDRAIPGFCGILREPVQNIPPGSFRALAAGDILFIDSSHVCRIASDLSHLIFSVLPALTSGVLIHFHDIFLPWEYPRRWPMESNTFWNEQYLLLAFLMFNDRFEILLGAHYLGRQHSAALHSAFPFLKDPAASADWVSQTPCSMWIRKK